MQMGQINKIMKTIMKIITKVLFTIVMLVLDILPKMIFGSYNGRVGNAKMDLHSIWANL